MIAQTGSGPIPKIPIGEWVAQFITFLQNQFGVVFDVVDVATRVIIETLVATLTFLPPLAMVPVLAVIAWLLAGWRVGILTLVGFLLIVSLGFWDASMQTLALVLAATALTLMVSVPLGVLAAKSRIIETIVTPVMDFMQTMPPFAYLIPVLVLF